MSNQPRSSRCTPYSPCDGIASVLFLVVLAYRVFLCAQAPEDTSDLLRHLGFSSHLFEWGAKIYHAVPRDFEPEFWTRFWTDQEYIYPPGAMVFFSLFSSAGLGLFAAKLALTLLDLVASVLISRMTSLWCGLLAFSAPVALWYTSHEGMYDGIVVLPLVISIFALDRRRWCVAGALFLLALQFKQFALFAAPMYLHTFYQLPPIDRFRPMIRFGIGMALGMLLFLPFYLEAPDLWIRPLSSQTTLYNPFAWNFFDRRVFLWNPTWLIMWNITASLSVLLVLAMFLIRRRKLESVFESAPLAGFWLVVKSLKWAQFWYVAVVPALALALRRHRRLVLILLLLHWLQCGRSMALLLGRPFGVREKQTTIDLFEKCIWRCDYQAPVHQ